MGVSTSLDLEQPNQYMWHTPASGPSQQHSIHTFSQENNNFGSMGSHLVDDCMWLMDLELPLNLSFPPLGDMEMESVPTNFPVPISQGSLPFRQDFMAHNQDMASLAMGLPDLNDEDFGTTSSLAVEASSSSDSSGSRSSLGHEKPTPTSSGSSEEGRYGQEDDQVAPKRAPTTKPNPIGKPKQPIPCSFSSCSRTFEKNFERRKHERIHTLPYKCPVPDCSKRGAEMRSVHRHLWTAHKDYALREKIPCEDAVCQVEGCGKVCRSDNMKRHMRLKHR